MTLTTISTATTAQAAIAFGNGLYIDRNGSISTTAVAITSTSSAWAGYIGIDGTVFSQQACIGISDATQVNVAVGPTGSLSSFNTAVFLSATDFLNVSNAGSIHSDKGIGLDLSGTGTDVNVPIVFDNTGQITSNGGSPIALSSGNEAISFTNSGVIHAGSASTSYLSSQGTKSVVNSGTIEGLGTGLALANSGAGNVSNSGTIAGALKGLSSAGALTLTNSGTIHGATDNALAVTGDLELRNTGDILTGASTAIYSNGVTHIHNAGEIVGHVQLDGTSGNTVTNTGNILGYVSLGGGDDVYVGHQGVVTDGVYGAAGQDRLYGGAEGDFLSGGDNADTVRGAGGDDTLLGGSGADLIRGGSGDDQITGGAGRDVLHGGSGADTFIYTSSTDGKGKHGDVIHGFHRGDDQIDVSAFGNLSFIGQNGFHHKAGEVRYTTHAGSSVVHVDVSGNGHDDLTIHLVHVGALSAADFVL